jgi:hypothetical protein
MTKSRGILGPRAEWTQEQLQTLREQYPNVKTADLAAVLSKTITAVYQKAYKFGLNKSAEFLASPASGRTNGRQGMGTRFTKGQTVWNKGMKGLQYEASKPTQFKPGQMPHTTRPVGSYRLDKDGTLQRKIGNGKGNNSARWRSVHELVWIEANGPLPPKHIVIFKPGKRTNILEQITLDRVECISLAENMRRNTVHNLPKELAVLVQLTGALNRKINGKQRRSTE